MKTTIVSKKGGVLIPNEIREKYNIKKGDRVNIVDYGNVISIIPASKEAIATPAGMFNSKKSMTKLLLEDRKKEIER